MFISGWIIALIIVGMWWSERENRKTLKATVESWKADLQIADEGRKQAMNDAVEGWTAKKESDQIAASWQQHADTIFAAYTDAIQRLAHADLASCQEHAAIYSFPSE